MPADLVRMLQLDYLYPPFVERLLSLLAECRMLGYDYKCYSGFRSTDEQRKLYEAYLAGGARAAAPGLSAHNYGLAVDCARVMPNGKLTWDKGEYAMLLKILPKHDLATGAGYSDLPHINYPGYESARQLLPLKTVYSNTTGTEIAKLQAVWQTIK